jgi:hypothetical protein
MLNYKQIVTELSSIAYHHPQIMSFGIGDLDQATMDVDSKTAPRYSRMYCIPGDTIFNQNHIHFNFSIIIMDIVNEDQSNLGDVLSDTLEICKDVWTIFWQSYTAEQGNFSYNLVGDWAPECIPFTERFDDVVAGFTMNLSLSMPFDFNACTPPVIDGFGFPQDQTFESYRVVNIDFEKFALLHKQINSYGFGNIDQITNDVLTNEEPLFPRMYCTPDTVSLNENHMHIAYKVVFADILNTDYTNQVEILSDTLEIVKDFYAKLYLSEYEAYVDAVVTPFLEEFETNLCGWTISLNIIQKFDYNRCVLPEYPFVRYTWEELQQLWKDVNVDWNRI